MSDDAAALAAAIQGILDRLDALEERTTIHFLWEWGDHQPKPGQHATSDWAHVTCPECLESRPT